MKAYTIAGHQVWVYSRSHITGAYYYEYRVMQGDNVVYDSGDENCRYGATYGTEEVALAAAHLYITGRLECNGDAS